MHIAVIGDDAASAQLFIEGMTRQGIAGTFFRRNEIRSSSYTSFAAMFFYHTCTDEDLVFICEARAMKPGLVVFVLSPLADLDLSYVDNYFVRPFAYPQIALSIHRHVLSKREKLISSAIRFSDMVLDITYRVLSRGSDTIFLRNREFFLLQFFMINAGRVVQRMDILEFVWDRNASLSTNTVDVHVSRLRQKLKKLDAHRYLRTIPCVGYQWGFDAMS